MSDMIEKLRLFLDSEEGKKSISEFVEKKKRERDILQSQLQRFDEKWGGRFDEAVEIVKNKYYSREYRNKEYKKGREPREYLIEFLFEYAKKYGRECTREEWEKHANSFTAEMYFVSGKYFGLCIGQGSYIFIQ